MWKHSEELLERLGIESIADVVRRSRLRWFGHVERLNADNWVSACREIQVEGLRVVAEAERPGTSV